jgi:hypothetical protein
VLGGGRGSVRRDKEEKKKRRTKTKTAGKWLLGFLLQITFHGNRRNNNPG